MQAFVRPFAGPADVIGWLGSRLTTLTDARAYDRRVQSVVDELRRLDDRELIDLGLARHDFRKLAEQSVAEGTAPRQVSQPTALDRAALWVAKRLTVWATRLQERRAMDATVRRLKAMSLRELEDIGLAPFEIPEAAANAVALRSAANSVAQPAAAANAA